MIIIRATTTDKVILTLDREEYEDLATQSHGVLPNYNDLKPGRPEKVDTLF